MITVEVTNSGGRTCEVIIQWQGAFGTHSRGLTDGNGHVSFEVSSGTGTIYVDGHKAYEGWISGTVRVSK